MSPTSDYSPIVLADQGLPVPPSVNPAFKPEEWRRQHRDEVIRTLALTAPIPSPLKTGEPA